MVEEKPILQRETLHQALESIYDNVALASSPLAATFSLLQNIARLDERAEKTRAMLLEAIEVLRPARRVAFGSTESRSYDILSLRYVENLPLLDVGRELSLSRRQLYRDLAEAEEKLVKVLASWQGCGEAKAPHIETTTSYSDELAALASQPSSVAFYQLLDEAIELAKPLAARLGVPLEVDLPPSQAQEVTVLTDRAIFKQLLVQVLSAAIQNTTDKKVQLHALLIGNECQVTVSFKDKAGLAQERLNNAEQLAASQRLSWQLIQEADGKQVITISVRRGQAKTVLVVEDNPGAVEMYRRYLSDGNWLVESVANPRLVLDTARRMQADVIILDIIMPGVDGWSIIKALRQFEGTRDIPLVVCSVLEDPKLAEALGADGYLKKPITRAELLAMLNVCQSRRSLRQMNV